MFNHKYRYFFILLLSVGTFAGTVLCQVYHYFDIEIQWYYALATITAITLGTWESNRLLDLFIKKRFSKARHRPSTMALFFMGGNFLATAITVIVVWFVGMILHRYSISESLIPLKLNLIYAWLANLLFHLMKTVYYYFSEYRNKLLEAEELKRMSAQAELQLIKSQLNPHFLFNNLNVLSTLVLQNNAEANRFIEEFSRLYRYILQNQHKELVELETELHYINPYVFLLEKRFADGLKINVNIPPGYGRFLIIPAAIQMLIENAIKHNVVSRSKPLFIDIHANGNNTIVVSNNLQAKQYVEGSTGIGLQNIMKRYQAVSNREVIIDTDERQFKVILPLINVN
ncbi:MAG: histidine kinase [Bacteroidetes bacterium]|nr:histidine kinase [Bacteroidota bacterium]